MFLVPLACAAIAVLFVRAVLGFQFPVPWPDETGFVAPAFDFARTGSFFDPGMNPDRVVMWMPPGYMVVLALVFRVLGYGYGLARWVSALCSLVALALAARLAWRLTTGWRRALAGWAVGLAFLSPYALVDANIARMEMLFCCMMLLVLTALVAGRPYVAAALLALGAIVHFNAVYFAPLVLADFAARGGSRRLAWPKRLDIAALAAAFVGIAFYGSLILGNRHGFVADMGFQFSLKRFYGQHDPAHPAWVMLAGILLGGALVWQRRRCDAAALTALCGVAFLVMAHYGHEIWYDYGQVLGCALLAVGALAEQETVAKPLWTVWTGAGLTLSTLLLGLHVTPAMAALGPRLAMLHRNIVAPADIAKVRAFIATLRPGATVDFGWTGMELFFLDDLARVGARWTIARHSVTQVWPLRTADWRVVCDSSEWPAMLLRFDIDHPRHGVDDGCRIFPGATHAAN